MKDILKINLLPKKYFKEKLGEESESFNFLEELVKSGKYSWKDIEEKVDIEDGKIVWKGNLDIRWTKIKKIKVKRIKGNLYVEGVENLEDIEVEEIEGNLHIEGTKVKKIKVKRIKGDIYANGVESLEEIEVEEEIGGYLNISGTKVKRIKAKRIKGDLDAEGVENLEDIEVEEEIEGNLYISGTKVKRIKAKRIVGNLNAVGVESLEEIEVEEEIEGYLDISGTSIDFQRKIIKKINKGELKVKGQLYFGGNIEGIERLCKDKNLVIPGDLDIRGTKVKRIKAKRIAGFLDARGLENLEELEVEEIVGDLDIKGTSIDFQLKIIEKINKGELKVKGEIAYDKKVIKSVFLEEGEIKRIYEEDSEFIKRYGNKLEKIEEEKLKKEAITIWNFVMKRVYDRTVEECTKYANNQDKEGIIKKSNEYEIWLDGYKQFVGRDWK